MNKVFISYRREDSQAHAGRLSDLLAKHLGDSVVFMDVDGISPGEDFVQKIGEQLSACSVFLSVIGPHWLRVRRGLYRRLFLPNDFVRLETLAALERSIPVIPVLVGGAKMPPARSLPKSIAALVERNAMEVTDNRFRTDVAALAEVIKTRVADLPETADDEYQLECERVTQIIETDIQVTRRHRRVRLATLLGSALIVVAIAIISWFTSRLNTTEPYFAEAKLTPDPPANRLPHPDDTQTWATLNGRGYNTRPQPFSRSRGGVEPILKLSEVLGSQGTKAVAAIEKSGQITFDAVGSTGNVKSRHIYVVTDQMVQDFKRATSQQPSFLFLLGDVVLNFGEEKYYYDQFYSPFRNFPAPILAIAGNHDGSIELGSPARPLDAFLANFCAEKPFHKSPDSLELDRTAQIQPGVYFTFEAPFVRILALYSNVSESAGIIGGVPELSNAQIDFLETAFTRIKNDRFQGAVILVVHHDVFRAYPNSGSPGMLAALDSISKRTGVWPHVVLSGHAHNYQRFTRTVDSTSIQYVVAGTGGATLASIAPVAMAPLHVPYRIGPSSDVVLQNYDDADYGYLRLTVNSKQLHLEFQPVNAAASAIDSFTLDLESRTLK